MGAQQRPIVSRRTHLLWLPQSPDAKHFNHQETLDPNTSSYDDKKRVLVRVSVGRNMMVASSKVYVRKESRGNGLQLTTRKRGFQKVGRVHGGVCTSRFKDLRHWLRNITSSFLALLLVHVLVQQSYHSN